MQQVDGVDLSDGASLTSLSRVWALILSSETWSSGLLDVSKELTSIIAERLGSLIDERLLEKTAVRLLYTLSGFLNMAAIDSSHHHMLPSCIRLVSLIVKLLLRDGALTSPDHQVALCEIAFLVIHLANRVINRFDTD